MGVFSFLLYLFARLYFRRLSVYFRECLRMLLRRFLSICGPVIPNREQIFTQQAQLHENICINTLIRSPQTMWCACMFGSAHGLWLCFLHLDSALCFSLCPLVFNTVVRPPALNSSVFVFFLRVGDGRRWESDVLQAGRTETWNGVLRPGMVWYKGGQ